jgi:hypothetical protein
MFHLLLCFVCGVLLGARAASAAGCQLDQQWARPVQHSFSVRKAQGHCFGGEREYRTVACHCCGAVMCVGLSMDLGPHWLVLVSAASGVFWLPTLGPLVCPDANASESLQVHLMCGRRKESTSKFRNSPPPPRGSVSAHIPPPLTPLRLHIRLFCLSVCMLCVHL